MNMNKWASDVKQSSNRIAIPLMTHPGIDLTGETVYNAVTDGNIHFEAIKALNKKYPAGASTIIMDLTVEAEAFGSAINFCQHDLPTITGRLVTDRASAEKLEIPGLDQGRIQQYILAAALASQGITGKPVFAGCIGPLSLAGRLFDMTEIMTALYLDPEVIHIILDKCSHFIIKYIEEFKRAGTCGVLIAEPAAGLVPENVCNEFSSAYIKKIIEKVQNETFIVILHNCGNIGHLTDSMINTGAAALHFGNKLDICDSLRHISGDILVLGNLDPVNVFKLSAPEMVYESTMDLLKKTTGYSNFIISSGCDVPPGVPHENIKAFYNALTDYNSSK